MALGVAVIGVGMVANVHLAALQEISEVTVCGVWSRTPASTRAFADKYGVYAYQSYEEVLQDSRVGAVILCTPPGYHADQGVMAAKAKKHVIIEKPMDISIEKARNLIGVCRQQGVKLSVIFQNRFTPAARQVKAALDQGVLGNLILGDAYVKWYRSPEYYTGNSWRGTRLIEGGGALINQAIHTIDLLQWFMGGVNSVYGLVRTSTHHIEMEDLGVAALEYVNGAIGVIEGSTAILPGFKERIELHGQKGAIVLEGGNIKEWKVEGYKESDYVLPEKVIYGASNSPAISHVNHKVQLEEIFQAILNSGEPLVNGEEGIRSLEIVLGIYESAAKRQPVSLA